MNINEKNKGFTLIEILIALTLVTMISLFLMQFMAPWMAFKQKLDTDRKLMETKSLISIIYERNAWAVETNAGPNFTFSGGVVTSSVLNSARSCNSQLSSLSGLSSYFSDGLPAGENDGYGNIFCFLISPQLSTARNGATIYYHNVAVVSTGKDSALDPATNINSATGALTLGGDDTGILVNGFTVQEKKFRETEQRLSRIAGLYETYFTSRFLANAARDVTIDYFAVSGSSGAWDTSGAAGVANTGGVEQPVEALLTRELGLGPEERQSSYESNNILYVGNFNECAGGACVRSSKGGNLPPFTSILYGALPGPSNNYLVKIATGNY